MRFWRDSSRAPLLLSICFNAVLITYILTQWSVPGGLGPAAGMPLRMIERVAERLPKEDAEVLWGIYHAKETELLPLQTEYRRSLLKAMQVASQPNLDKAALEAAVNDARDKRLKIGDAVIATFTEMLQKISAKGRRQLVGGYFH